MMISVGALIDWIASGGQSSNSRSSPFCLSAMTCRVLARNGSTFPKEVSIVDKPP
jgi:hypothetical protein